MVTMGPPAYFVVTNRGDRGPFDLSDLRDALGRGDITSLDQVRSPLGSPLGTVRQVLNRGSDRSAPAHFPAQAAPRSGPPWAIIAVIAALLLVALVLSLLGTGSQAAPAVTPPQPVQPPASRLPEQPRTAPAPAPPAPPARPAPSAPSAPPPAKPAVNANTAINLLASAKWSKGKTTVTEQQKDGDFWTLRFSDWSGWAGFDLPANCRDWRNDLGLGLSVRGNGGATTFQIEIIEHSRERHIASFQVEGAHWREVRIPWSQFTRRDYQGDDPKKAAPDDGLQLANMTFLTILSGGKNAASALSLRSIAPYR